MSSIALIVIADDGLAVFSSIGAAETYMEAVDVEDGVYSGAYDSDGRLYSIQYSGIGAWDPGQVEILPTDTIDKEAASNAIRLNSKFPLPETATFTELVAALERHVRPLK
ncbi:MAG: hypothetical protein J0L52_10720 [Caulobacterales bacterium]|nr:hypothetical protein [Caulobacterales bacterium]